jgi:hypothetical protein
MTQHQQPCTQHRSCGDDRFHQSKSFEYPRRINAEPASSLNHLRALSDVVDSASKRGTRAAHRTHYHITAEKPFPITRFAFGGGGGGGESSFVAYCVFCGDDEFTFRKMDYSDGIRCRRVILAAKNERRRYELFSQQTQNHVPLSGMVYNPSGCESLGSTVPVIFQFQQTPRTNLYAIDTELEPLVNRPPLFVGVCNHLFIPHQTDLITIHFPANTTYKFLK